MSVSQRLKLALSMNCLNSSVSSRITAVITRSSALSCSMRAFWRSEFCRALRNAVSAATRAGMVSVMSRETRSASSQRMSPKCSLKVPRMLESRSRSASGRWPPAEVGGDAGWNGLDDELRHAVGVLPADVAEVLVEGAQDVGEPVQVRLGAVAAGGGGHRADLGVLVRQQDLLHRLLLDPVAVQVDGVQDALGQVLLLRRAESGAKEPLIRF